MTNYNDGKWHGWNGGECPVHPESLIEVLHAKNGVLTSRRAGITAWEFPDLVAFRVVKEYREPREFWLYRDSSEERFRVSRGKPTAFWDEVIHVREVTE